MKKNRKIIAVFILCSIFLISGCKPQKDIVGEIMPLATEYKNQPIMEYFQNENRSVYISSSKGITNEDNSLMTQGMQLEYYPDENKAYGVYFTNRTFDEGREREINEIPIMLNEEGYHVKEGYELIEEIRSFKFMSEEVDFSNDYLQNLKIEDTSYNFEVPSYSVTYRISDENQDLERYLENENLFQYGDKYSIVFSKKGNGYNGGSVKLKVDGEVKRFIREWFDHSVGEGNNKYKNQFLGEEITTNE